MQNNATFLKSSFNLNGTFVQMLHFHPNFTRKPMSIRYEISGTDGLVHEGEHKITDSNSKKQIITFECKLDETYFCKVTGYFTESKNAMQTIRLFYKVENDMDDVVVKDILRQIKSQVDFDPYKTNLSKDVIYEIYNKYFDNDIFVKLKNNNDDSKTYLAAGNFNYVPQVAKADYDLVTYQNLTNNLQLGINPLTDGIINKTKINRG
jgi:hypothetical protein